MLKKNWFYISLIIIYCLFLSKNYFWGYFDNTDKLFTMVNNNKVKYYQNEYKKMQQLLDINVGDYDIIYSKIILRDIYAFYEKIVISKGSNDGVKKQDLVVNELGVIGVVNNVYKNSCEVILLTNSLMQLSVKINDSYGILTSDDKQIIVKNIKLDKKINVGDLVYTSGLTNIPENFLIGKVKDIKEDKLGLEYIIEVDSISNLQNINYVAIIKGIEDLKS